MGDRGFQWLPKEYVTEPQDSTTVVVVRNGWWATNEKGEVLFYFNNHNVGSPQMNINETVARRLTHRIHGSTGLMQIPLAFYPVDVRNY